MKRVAILCFTNFVTEPRVLRTIEALRNKYDITLYSCDKTLDGISCTDVSGLNKDNSEINFYKNYPGFLKRIMAFILKLSGYYFQSAGYYKRQFWSPGRKELLEKMKAQHYDLVIGHGVYTLPILAALKTKTIFNAHEYYFKEFEENNNWKKYIQPYYKFLLDKHLPEIDLMFCVSKAIQNEYQKEYNINSIEVTNATSFSELAPGEIKNNVRIIHHGGAIRTRQLELMAEMMAYLPEMYSLTFMLTSSDAEYLAELKELYKNRSDINFIEPVPVNKIAETCNCYDIGLFILPPVNFNWYNALPNKLFEFIQGRLCIAVSPNPDMKRLVEEYSLGVVAADYTAEGMAKEILKLDKEKIFSYKKASDRCARIINAESTQKMILDKVKELIN